MKNVALPGPGHFQQLQPGFVTNGEDPESLCIGFLFQQGQVRAYKNKYLLEAVGRYDGSSKFIQENRWKAFYGRIRRLAYFAGIFLCRT